MITRLTPVATLINTKQQATTASFSMQILKFCDICAIGRMLE